MARSTTQMQTASSALSSVLHSYGEQLDIAAVELNKAGATAAQMLRA